MRADLKQASYLSSTTAQRWPPPLISFVLLRRSPSVGNINIKWNKSWKRINSTLSLSLSLFVDYSNNNHWFSWFSCIASFYCCFSLGSCNTKFRSWVQRISLAIFQPNLKQYVKLKYAWSIYYYQLNKII